MADIKAIGDQLVELSVKEVTELASYLKETYGIEPAAAVAVAGPAAGGGGGAAAAEKTNFDVVLKAPGANKLQIVKLVKELREKTVVLVLKILDTQAATVFASVDILPFHEAL